MMNLSESAKNALTRVIENGVEKAAEKLAQMSRTKWEMQTVSVTAGIENRLPADSRSDDQQYYGAYSSMPGGCFLALFSLESGNAIVKTYLGPSAARMQGIPDMEGTVLAEVSNVLTNAVAAAFAEACEINFLLSAPTMEKADKRKIFEGVLRKFFQPGKSLAVTSYVHMSSPALSTDCSIIILLNEEMADRLLQTLGAL